MNNIKAWCINSWRKLTGNTARRFYFKDSGAPKDGEWTSMTFPAPGKSSDWWNDNLIDLEQNEDGTWSASPKMK